MTIQLKISGMNCQHCVGAVTRALESVPGALAVQVDLASAMARIEGEAGSDALPRALIGAVTEAGYAAEVVAG